jgi:transposase
VASSVGGNIVGIIDFQNPALMGPERRGRFSPIACGAAKRTVVGIDIGKNSFHVVGLDKHGAIALRQKWSRGQVEARFANMPACLIGMEACVGAHHLSRKLQSLGHDARLMPAKYVRPYSKGQKNDFRDAEAIAEAVQRPTMRFVATR